MTPFFTLLVVLAIAAAVAVPLGLWADNEEDRRNRK